MEFRRAGLPSGFPAAPLGAAWNVDAVARGSAAQIVDLGPLSLDQQIIARVVAHPQRFVRVGQTLVDGRRQLAHTGLPSTRGEVRSTHGMVTAKPANTLDALIGHLPLV
jgi:hypothetical protein